MGGNIDITVEDGLDNFFDVNIINKYDGYIHLSKQTLIDQIIQDLRLDHDSCSTKDDLTSF